MIADVYIRRGPGILGLDGHALRLTPLCGGIYNIAERSTQFYEEKEREKRMLSVRCAEKHRAAAQLVSCS